MKNKYKQIILGVSSAVLYSYGGYQYGNNQALQKLKSPNGWEKLPSDLRQSLSKNALEFVNWSNLEKNKARSILSNVLDASVVPDGDMAVPSNTVHSRRHFISKWQRTATGATIIVLGKDDEGNLCTALGDQRGALRHPQGFMEVPLPKEDLTGLKAQNASRMNGNTGEIVLADISIESNAVREVYEELGLSISENQLKLLRTTSDMKSSPICIAANYYVILPNTPQLNTIDKEFVSDDLSKPAWVKIKDIQARDGKFYVGSNPLPVDPNTVKQLRKALELSGYKFVANGLASNEKDAAVERGM